MDRYRFATVLMKHLRFIIYIEHVMPPINNEQKELIYKISHLSNVRKMFNNKTNTLNFDTLLEMIDRENTSFANKIDNLGEPLTVTIEKQIETEVLVQEIYEDVLAEGSDNFPTLNRRPDLVYTSGFLTHELPGAFSKLDASKTWITYWLMNAHILLEGKISDEISNQASQLMILSTDPKSGGFGGGPGQLAHLAASYAAILTLALSNNQESWKMVNRVSIKKWLLSLKQSNGSFVMHPGGESDCRAVYCALSIASLLDIIDKNITDGVVHWLINCQTYEGGFSGEPGDEAHGGYTFCALAALCILLSPEEISKCLNMNSLINWTVNRQYGLEGGLSGRTNKLVDGCYSHWVGGTIALLEAIISENGIFTPLINRMGLQNYILCCCQDLKFGLRDKPGCSPDFYHTNYVLCGLSMCQHIQKYNFETVLHKDYAFAYFPERITDIAIVDNLEDNKVAPLDAIFGLPYGYAMSIRTFYRNL